MLTVTRTEGRTIEIDVDGRVLHEDYERIVPEFEKIIQEHGRMRCLMNIRHISGVEPRAMIDEVKFDVRHLRQIERCAVVCEKGWVQWVSRLWGLVMPMTEVKVFEPGQAAEARAWLER